MAPLLIVKNSEHDTADFVDAVSRRITLVCQCKFKPRKINSAAHHQSPLCSYYSLFKLKQWLWSQTVPPSGFRKLMSLTKMGLQGGCAWGNAHEGPVSKTGDWQGEDISKSWVPQSSFPLPSFSAIYLKLRLQVGLRSSNLIEDQPLATHNLWTWKAHALPTEHGSL